MKLLQLGRSGIRVATHLTELRPKAVLQRKPRAAKDLARKQLGQARSD